MFHGNLKQPPFSASWTPTGQSLSTQSQKTEKGTLGILCYYPLSGLPGGLVTASRLDEKMQGIKTTQNLLVTGIVLLGICFCLFISKLIDMVLKRFYRVVSAIESIQSENLSVGDT